MATDPSSSRIIRLLVDLRDIAVLSAKTIVRRVKADEGGDLDAPMDRLIATLGRFGEIHRLLVAAGEDVATARSSAKGARDLLSQAGGLRGGDLDSARAMPSQAIEILEVEGGG